MKTLGLYEQPFKINLNFDNHEDFEKIMKINFNLSLFQSNLLYEAYFSYNKTFLYHDLSGLFENQDDFHNFLANNSIVHAD
jgi:hypothetical protein